MSDYTANSAQEMNMKAVNDLLNWKNNLPQELQVDLENVKRPYLPHVLFLHMQYYQNMIHAHRPWMSRLGQPTPPKGPGCEHARMMCIESAATIGKLLYIYELQYSFKRMNIHGVGITCSAASFSSLLLSVTTRHYPLTTRHAISTPAYVPWIVSARHGRRPRKRAISWPCFSGNGAYKGAAAQLGRNGPERQA
uniref:Uncharacterized protein n=1 Tax=Bionectria ochroleuca TaxID=29856 RepID=A0A8H7KFI6_BIOOC